jgi:hypothetical protein
MLGAFRSNAGCGCHADGTVLGGQCDEESGQCPCRPEAQGKNPGKKCVSTLYTTLYCRASVLCILLYTAERQYSLHYSILQNVSTLSTLLYTADHEYYIRAL